MTLTLWFRREEAACFGMEGADAPRRALLGRVQGLLSGPPPPSLEQSALGRSWQRAKAKAEPLVSEELCPPLSCCRAGPPPLPPGGQAVGVPPVPRAVPPPPSLPAPLGPGSPSLRAYPPRSPTPGGARPAGHGPRLRARRLLGVHGQPAMVPAFGLSSDLPLRAYNPFRTDRCPGQLCGPGRGRRVVREVVLEAATQRPTGTEAGESPDAA